MYVYERSAIVQVSVWECQIENNVVPYKICYDNNTCSF